MTNKELEQIVKALQTRVDELIVSQPAIVHGIDKVEKADSSNYAYFICKCGDIFSNISTFKIHFEELSNVYTLKPKEQDEN